MKRAKLLPLDIKVRLLSAYRQRYSKLDKGAHKRMRADLNRGIKPDAAEYWKAYTLRRDSDPTLRALWESIMQSIYRFIENHPNVKNCERVERRWEKQKACWKGVH